MNIAIEDVQALLRGYSFEVTPKGYADITFDLKKYVPERTYVFVTHLQGARFDDSLLTVKKLIDDGFTPVPHVVARNFIDRDALFEAVSEYQKIGIKDILLIAGGAPVPKGELSDTLSLLVPECWEDFSFDTIAFAGHPEGHPFIESNRIWDVTQQKQQFSMQFSGRCVLITQFAFLAKPMIDWCYDLSLRNINLPVRMGIPGVAGVKSLLKHAQACGVGTSINFLKNNKGIFSKLLGVSTPDRLLLDLCFARKQGEIPQFEGLHFYPLGGLEKTLQWLNQVAQGNIKFNHKGGFCVTP